MRFDRVVAIVAAGFLLYAGGLLSGVNSWPPAGLVTTAIDTLKDLKTYAEAEIYRRPNQHLRPRIHAGDGVVVSLPDRMEPGVTLLSGVFGQVLGFRLYAADGTLIHEWPIDFFTLAPEVMNHRYHALIHGEHLYPNGDIVANFDGRRLVRFDRCGKIVWQNEDKPHHAVDIDDAGRIWTPLGATDYSRNGYIPFPYRLDRIGAFDPDTGAKLDEIDLSAILTGLDLPGLIQPNPAEAEDLGHLNDVEILSATDAPAYPGFAAGDILLSIRNFDQIWVLDGQTRQVKWTFSGPMLGQHDPDFGPDGRITLFDNRPSGNPTGANDYLGGLGGSRIISIDPVTKASTVLFASRPGQPFYSAYRGKHQRLANGNILIAETDAGRAIEVTPSGDIVWSFVNGWDDASVAWIMGATRYPASYAEALGAGCP